MQNSPFNIAEADEVLSQLLTSPRGSKHIPKLRQIMDNAVISVKEEAKLALMNLTRDLPQRSRFRSTIVTRLCGIRGRCFTVAEMEDICQVTDGYVRKRSYSKRKNGTSQQLDPLYAEKLRGFKSGDRNTVSEARFSIFHRNWSVHCGSQTKTSIPSLRRVQQQTRKNARFCCAGRGRNTQGGK